MRKFFTWLLTIDSPDEDLRRRGRNVVTLTLGLIILVLAILLNSLFVSVNLVGLASLVVGLLIYCAALLLARRGLVTLGALMLIAIQIVGTCFGTVTGGYPTIVPFFLVLSLLIAGLSLRPWQIWLVLAADLLGLAAAFLALPTDLLNEPLGYVALSCVVFILGIVALMSFLGAKSTSTAIEAAQRARAQAEAAAQALSQLNADLESTVSERTTALQKALEDVQARSDAQAHLLAEVEQQRSTIRELSVPVIPISATTLIMPLVGALDSTRLMQIQEQALQALQRSAARHLILDITGVPIVDSQVAQGLVSVVEAARLLGTGVMLVGIRPEVAQAIVGLGLNLQGIYTASDLQSALGRIAPR
jgi:rsbT co-antagonist protein RsbR